GIVFLDRRGNDHDFGLAEIVTALADLDLNAHIPEALDIGIERGVGALHRIALVMQDFGNATHADAADADEVDRADIAGHFHEADSNVLVPWPARLSARSASFSTARG